MRTKNKKRKKQKHEIIRFVAVASPTNYTKMSDRKRKRKTKSQKKTKKKKPKKLNNKKQCHTCQSCRRMTQMRLGLLTNRTRTPAGGPVAPAGLRTRTLTAAPRRALGPTGPTSRRRHHQQRRFAIAIAIGIVSARKTRTESAAQRDSTRISWKFHN